VYNFKEIEKKWQKYWEDSESFIASNNSDKKKYYILIEFPYPSGVGLHVGHVRSYSALDTLARKRRMEGYNVLFPMGWDAFGSPAEQYAIANKIHPKVAVMENIKTFKSQIKAIGISFDWSREFSTTDPDYYKWTQWQFLKFYEHNLAYKTKRPINWCSSCKVGLSNEDAEGGVCERCGTKTIQIEKEQWLLRMSNYAEQLIDGLDDNNFQQRIKMAQINWIGKSIGVEVNFKIANSNEVLKVFTTRPDTIYGVTFMVIAPEHPLIIDLKEQIDNYNDIEIYCSKASLKTEFERTELAKDKTGIKLAGIKAVNPVSNELIEIWVSDYVMMNYGAGAIMAVPAHDERDFEFAKKFNLSIRQVIAPHNVNNSSEKYEKESSFSKDNAYTGDGIMINSDFLNGINNKEEAIAKISNYIEEKKIGKRKTHYKLQDWVFSRQRFWGEPIPMIYCNICGWVSVPEKDLPVLLPDVAKYEPTETGESPLAMINEWVNTICPKCGIKAKRETDTMPNWAGSSWYWLRYMDPNNDKEFVSKEALRYWGKVDWYNGGMEHATRHLLYARFWNQFLYNIGLVPNKEPFELRTAHGMILGSDGVKMSKSKGNVINPDDVINEMGADSLRIYEMFIGDYEKEVSWITNGLKGCKRFLDRVWKVQNKMILDNKYSSELETLIHKTIRKVTNDIETMKYNTAVSSLMILLNAFEKQEHITKADLRTFLILLNPFAPHITEEINEINVLGEAIYLSNWPTCDETKIVDSSYELVIQINGKIRSKIIVNKDVSEKEIEEIAFAQENIRRYIEDHDIIKVVIIPNKLINIVIK